MSYGLEHCFVDKSKNVKKVIAVSFEEVVGKVTPTIENDQRENFHEFLRAYTDIFAKNVYASKDYTFHNLRGLMNNENLAIVSGDKDSCVVIMNRNDYYSKIQEMIDKGIQDKVYEPTTDTTLDDLKLFQSFLYRNFSKYKHYQEMYPSSSQPARLYGTAKTHKCEHLNDINLNDLKFRPIIAQTGTYTYKAAQVIGKYLKPLCSDNKYIIRNTQDFPKLLLDEPPLNENEEYISYNV
ncbi:uncharacterized protein [Clytia hemisphaerica]|uniref:uncharacterized protein n=1 Tax=Clytia hemisphaerica TaxID=252671 RepID=UPI0034D6F2FA